MSGLIASFLGIIVSAFSAVLMYSSFSQQRVVGKRFWGILMVCTLIRLPIAYATTGENGIFRLAIGFFPLLFIYCLLYTGTFFLKLFIAIVFYSWSICIDNVVYTTAFALAPKSDWLFSGKIFNFFLAILVHILILLLCIFVKKMHPYPCNSAGIWVVAIVLSTITTGSDLFLTERNSESSKISCT